MAYDSDVVVIGSGAGGATFAYACAAAGRSVLLLERGYRQVSPAPSASPAQFERSTFIDKAPYDDRAVEINGVTKRLYMGGIFGGGTSLYGAALMRPRREDFSPGRQYGSRLPRELWEWPVTYEEFNPYYARAERLMGITDEADADLRPPVGPDGQYVNHPLPLHPINRKLMEANRARGLRPFRLPLAVDAANCLSCGACAGYVCPTGARRSAGQLAERAVAAGMPLRVLTGVEVERLSFGSTGAVDAVHVVERASGRRAMYRARGYALAAGAVHSPLLLMRSGVTAPLVGRHYMMHLSPIAVGIFGRPTRAEDAFVKQVGFWDYYFGDETCRHKLGLVQSLPVPGPLLAAKSAPRDTPIGLVNYLRRRMLPLAGIVEDLPDPANRIAAGPGHEPRIRHRFSEYDLYRGRHLGRLMARILKAAGAAFCLPTRFASNEHVAHQCGTLRFGLSPATAVADPDCRLFGFPNAWVVDGSFLPTSLGVGPALTIMANALRVAGMVIKEI